MNVVMSIEFIYRLQKNLLTKCKNNYEDLHKTRSREGIFPGSDRYLLNSKLQIRESHTRHQMKTPIQEGTLQTTCPEPNRK